MIVAIKPVIIGISGKIGSGKDTLADMIIKYDSQFTKKSFAYKLKMIGMNIMFNQLRVNHLKVQII